MSEPELDPVARLVHDLRSPMAVAQGFAVLLERDDIDEASRTEYLKRIVEAVHEMNAVLDAAPRPQA